MTPRPTHLRLVPPPPTITDVAVAFFDILLSYEIAQEATGPEHCGPEHGRRLREELVAFAGRAGFTGDAVWAEMARVEASFEEEGPEPGGGERVAA